MRIALPLLILTFAAPLRADDPIVPREKPAAEVGEETKPRDSKKDAKTGDAKKPPEPGKKADESLLDPEVQKELRNLIYGPDDKKKADDPLESAIRGMRSAKDKIAGKETGQSTRDVQQKVIEDLEKLIEQAKNQKPPPSGQSNSPKPNQDQKNQDQQNQDKPSGGEKKPQDGQSPMEGSGNAGQSQESAKSRESSDQDRKAREEEAERARRRDFIKDVWGHLPPNLRQKLLNIADEKSVPRYDDIVRRYFESLAEEGTRDKQK